VYLDTAATTPVRQEVLEAMWPFLAGGEAGPFGNPSSRHETGERAAAALVWARGAVATALGCRPAEVIFTSGGTESDNLAVKGLALASSRGRHLITSPIEHDAVRESVAFLRRLHGFEVTELAVDRDGRVDPDEFRAALRSRRSSTPATRSERCSPSRTWPRSRGPRGCPSTPTRYSRRAGCRSGYANWGSTL
jgi:cysteine desulfurase